MATRTKMAAQKARAEARKTTGRRGFALGSFRSITRGSRLISMAKPDRVSQLSLAERQKCRRMTRSPTGAFQKELIYASKRMALLEKAIVGERA